MNDLGLCHLHQLSRRRFIRLVSMELSISN